MSDEQKAMENEVFDQELSLDDLDAAAGGDWLNGGPKDYETWDCINHVRRDMYGAGGFPNCAATVEDGSHCASNDACYSKAVDYQGLTDCAKAWR